MTARDSVAGLGGTAAHLAEAANPVYQAQPGAVGDLGGKFTACAGAVDGSSRAVGTSVGALDGAWQGASADAFVGYMGKFTQAGSSLGEALTAAATDLNGAVTGLNGAREALEGMFGDLYDNANAWLKANQDKTDDEKRQHVDGLAAGYQGRVTEQVDNAERAVQAAATALGGRAGAINPKFSVIPDPGTQTFTPAPGKPIEWTPTPPSQTSPSSAKSSDHSATGSGSGHSNGSDSGSSSSGSGGGGGLGSSGGPPAGPPPGNVQEWITQAIAELRARGINVTEADSQLIWEIIQHESGGNPNAINNWDSNAAKGTPSKGLMQCIDPTFQSHQIPGHGDIWNPVDNICAGVNYAISRYGSLSNVPGIKATHGGGGYVGY